MTIYLPGSQGEAVALALSDEKFRERVRAFVEVRTTLLEELTRAETGHHSMRDHVRCTETSRLDAKWKNHPGYLTAWFSLRSFRVRLRFIGGDASLDAFEARIAFYENGRACSAPLVEDRGGWRSNDIERLGLEWRAGNSLFWHALALVRETTHPQLCGVCLTARVKSDGATCGCEYGDRVTVSRTATAR